MTAATGTAGASKISPHPLSGLRNAIRGAVQLPGDPAYDDVRRPWNRAVAQNVAAVVEPVDTDDVADLVRYARERGLRIAVQPSGHGATGTATGTILVRTTRLDRLAVDPATRTARIGGGVSSGMLTAAAAAHGLVHKPGSSPVVSVAGYTLGGGVGWFARRYGLAAEHVLEFEVVDARGRVLRVSEREHADLFYALCGGGGDFAVVTALTVRLHHEPELFGGTVAWPVSRAGKVFEAYRSVAAAAPRELTVWTSLLRPTDGTPPLVTVSVAYLGAAEKAWRYLTPLDALCGTVTDTRRLLTHTEIGTITNDPASPVASASRAELLRDLDDDAVAALLAEPIDPLVAVQVRQLGGALADHGVPRPGPHGRIAERFAVYLAGRVPTAEARAAVAARQADLVAALGPAVTGRKPLTFLNPVETVADAFPPAVVERLQGVKRDWDPAGTIVGNFPVGTAGAGTRGRAAGDG